MYPFLYKMLMKGEAVCGDSKHYVGGMQREAWSGLCPDSFIQAWGPWVLKWNILHKVIGNVLQLEADGQISWSV